MAYDHEEQEQLAALKHWWSKNGNRVTWAAIVVLAGVVTWQGWGIYQNRQSQQAAQLYVQVQKAAEAQDNDKIQRAADDMMARFSGTAYAQMSALIAAKSSYAANDVAGTRQHLEWVLAHGEDEFRAIAAVRLAGVLMDEKSYDDALAVLGKGFPEEFASMVADRRGDVLRAQGKIDEARAAYSEAMAKAGKDDPARQLIQLKLDAIGGAAAKA